MAKTVTQNLKFFCLDCSEADEAWAVSKAYNHQFAMFCLAFNLRLCDVQNLLRCLNFKQIDFNSKSVGELFKRASLDLIQMKDESIEKWKILAKNQKLDISFDGCYSNRNYNDLG